MRKVFLFLSFSLLAISLLANNIMVSNVSLTGQNTVDEFTLVQFDLSWENSWRISVGPNNWDAAWVFVKYRVNGDLWRHATINYVDGTNDGHTAPAGARINTVANQTGVFIHRSADGSGDVNYQNVQLRWNYGADGVDENAIVDIQVFAIEMVYVPEAAYQLGTGNLFTGDVETGRFRSLFQIDILVLPTPYDVTSEAAITVSNTVGNLWYDNSEQDPGDQLGPIPAAYPKGFSAFYCQKYETSQDQWVSFFNTLTPGQKTALDVTGPGSKNSDDIFVRNAVSWPDAGSATTTLPNVPINYAPSEFYLAYLDWAGLRPMTEMEYEKACRGTLSSVVNGFAWGSTNIHGAPYTIINEGAPNELISDPGSSTGNANYMETNGITNGPKRCGIFPASALINNREETGATYYGIMEMSGNVYERAISAGNPEGRAFTGEHGDGVITGGGRHNVANWPSGDEGIGYRGGAYPTESVFLTVSDRTDAANSFSGSNGRIGFRGVRTAE